MENKDFDNQSTSRGSDYDKYKEDLKNYYKKKTSKESNIDDSIDDFAEPLDSLENEDIASEDNNISETKSSKVMGLLNYAKVLIGFFLIVFIVYAVIDSWILPSMIHSKDMVLIPKVSGTHIDEAKDKLLRMDLLVEVTGEQFNAKVPPKTVIRQSPNPNTEVKAGRTVYLTISKGKQTVEVPYLIGKSVREAKVVLLNKGFLLKQVVFRNSETIPKDSIIKQNHKHGQFIPIGSEFVLTVSKGSENQILVPRLEGMAYEDIEDYLMVNGFVLGEVKYKTSDTYLPGAIIGQYPLPGETVPYNSTIDIIVAE